MAPEVLLGRGSFLHLFRDDLQNEMQTSVPISSEDCSLMASSGLERLNDEDRALPAGTARPVTFGRSVCASTNFSASQLHLQPRCVASCAEFFLLGFSGLHAHVDSVCYITGINSNLNYRAKREEILLLI